jgi:hypothetical protein
MVKWIRYGAFNMRRRSDRLEFIAVELYKLDFLQWSLTSKRNVRACFLELLLGFTSWNGTNESKSGTHPPERSESSSGKNPAKSSTGEGMLSGTFVHAFSSLTLKNLNAWFLPFWPLPWSSEDPCGPANSLRVENKGKQVKFNVNLLYQSERPKSKPPCPYITYPDGAKFSSNR